MKHSALIFFVILLLCNYSASGQDPQIPSVNLGFTNMQAGKSRPPGLYYIQYIQIYQARNRRDAYGRKIENAVLSSSITTLQQVAYISNSKFLNGNPGFTVLSVLTKTSPKNNSQSITVNPSPFGDVIAGPFVQWYDKHFLNMPLSHRFGINIGFPAGAYSQQYNINPSAHLFRIFPHYELTLTPVNEFSLSLKNNFYYFFNQIGTESKPGITYNLNYALEYHIYKRLTVELAGYYLTQFMQDSHSGDYGYYKRNFNMPTTKERLFSVGPGMGYTTKSGLSVEIKTMWEMKAKNRLEGVRSTFLLSYRL